MDMDFFDEIVVHQARGSLTSGCESVNHLLWSQKARWRSRCTRSANRINHSSGSTLLRRSFAWQWKIRDRSFCRNRGLICAPVSP